MDHHLFVLGLGYVGQAFAHHFKKNLKGAVSGTTRSLEKGSALRPQEFTVLTSVQDPQFLPLLSTATHILWTVPPGGETLPPSFLASVSLPRLEWMGYISSTSVYGDHQGESVDEETVPRPNTPEGEARLAMEKALLQLSPVLPLHIFRCAGIYGPGRNVLHNILQGKAQRIDHPGVVFSRIHLEDIITILEASRRNPHPGQIYNMADDHPASTADLVAYGTELLKTPPLPLLTLEEANLSEMGRSFYRSSKRVLNHKIKTQLDVVLRFPSYREGLNALMEEM